MTNDPLRNAAVRATVVGLCFASGLAACTASRPNAKTPIGPRPGPEDEATQQERTGARHREGIAPPKAGPEQPPAPPLNARPPAPAGSRGAGGGGA